MRVALLTTFAATRKEPLAALFDRVHQAFLDAGLGEPVIHCNFADAPLAGFVSSVDRVLKRHPELNRFVTSAPLAPGIPGTRRISNGPLSPAANEAIPYATLQEIAGGVPRSFPFHQIAIHLHLPSFGTAPPLGLATAAMLPGIVLADSWWVNGRNRSLSACTIVDADPAGRKLPPLPAPIAALLAACGKIKRTIQAPIPDEIPAGPTPGVRSPTGAVLPSANPEALRAVQPIVQDYRARLVEIVERAHLPHDLTDSAEAHRAIGLGVTSGPRKPALDRAFKPLGYSCRGGSGTFTLRRRTPSHLTVDINMDVGTWGHSVLAMYRVWGLGFKATLPLPVSAKTAVPAQYPIGDAEHWQKIVDNFAALVAELDRSFVPALEAAAGPSPDWYQPES